MLVRIDADTSGPEVVASPGQQVKTPELPPQAHIADQRVPPAALLNSSSDRFMWPAGGAGRVMWTQSSAFSTTLISMPSGTSMPCSFMVFLGSLMKRALMASSRQHAAISSANFVLCSVIDLLHGIWCSETKEVRVTAPPFARPTIIGDVEVETVQCTENGTRPWRVQGRPTDAAGL